MNQELKKIPRVPSRAPNKNTMEWEIPNEVLVSLMLIERIGWTAGAKVKVKKKHFWSSPWKKFFYVSHRPDAGMAMLKALEFLEKYNYIIDPDSVQFGEKIGDPEYFKSLGM